MQNKKLNDFKAISLDPNIVDKIISFKDSDAALLYIYIMSHDGKTPQNPKSHLGFSVDRLNAAQYILDSINLPTTPKATHISPTYTNLDIKTARTSDDRFMAICDSAENVLGKALSIQDLKILLTGYTELKIPAEVIIELLSYIKDKKGTISRRDIEKELYHWSDMGIFTYELATKYITDRTYIENNAKIVFKDMGFEGRVATEKEEVFICSFLEMGFKSDAITLAYSRMLRQKNKFSWTYLAKILENFHNSGLHTVDEIEKASPSKATVAVKNYIAQSGPINNDEWFKEVEEAMKNGQ